MIKTAMLTALVAVGLLAAPVCSFAADEIPGSRTRSGSSFVMCDAQTVAGICDSNGQNTGSDEYARVDGFDTITFFLTETGTGSSCDIYATSKNDDIPGIANLDTGTASNKINSVALTLTQDKISFTGSFYYAWVHCTSVGSTTTVIMQGRESFED